MKRFPLLALIVIALWLSPKILSASATNFYVTPSGSAYGNCPSASANAPNVSYSSMSSANWGSGSSQIGPGTAVLLCGGTVTFGAGATAFDVVNGGTSSNPVTIKFDTGLVLQAPYFSGSGALSGGGLSYVVLDGNGGTIQNTSNGTNLSSHQNSHGVLFSNCTNCEIKNLTVRNIYVNNGSSSSASDTAGANTSCIEIDGASTLSNIHNNTVSQCKTGIMLNADSNADASNTEIAFNTIQDMDWGVNVGGGDSQDTFNNVSIHDNTITNWTNWQFPTNNFHQDGIILFNFGNPSAGFTANVYNNYIYGDLGVGSPTGFIYCADFTSCTVYNNLLVNTGHTIDGIMWLGQTTNNGKNMYVYNNTIVSNQNDIGITLTITGHATIENNIIVGVGTGIHDYHTLTSTVTTSNNNVWQNGSGSAPNMASNDSSFVSYSSWKSSGFDSASTNANPNLDSTYHLGSGSSAISLAANLDPLGILNLQMDKAGNPRATVVSVNWDAGAYVDVVAGGPPPPSGVVATAQ